MPLEFHQYINIISFLNVHANFIPSKTQTMSYFYSLKLIVSLSLCEIKRNIVERKSRLLSGIGENFICVFIIKAKKEYILLFE